MPVLQVGVHTITHTLNVKVSTVNDVIVVQVLAREQDGRIFPKRCIRQA
jgi:hypothetical protein